MRKIKKLFYLITIGIAIFALDDIYIVQDINMISYESSNAEQNIEYEKVNQDSIVDEKVDKEEINDTNINHEADIDQSEKNSNSQVKVEKKEENKNVVKESTQKVETSSTKVNNVKVDYIQEIKNNNDKLGTLGRLYIPSVSLNVGVNYAQAFGDGTYTAQEIVDKKDSAAYYKAAGKYTIADHNYQGFNKINNVSVGDKAYIKNVDGTITTMIAKSRFLGENLKYDIVDKNGNSVYDMAGDIVMYTCYKNSKTTIMIVLWEIENN